MTDRIRATILVVLQRALIIARQIKDVGRQLFAIARFHVTEFTARHMPGLTRYKLRFWLSLAVVVGALLSTVATFLILNGLTWIIPTNNVVITTLGINALFVLVITGIIAVQIVKVLRARRKQAAGASLHVRIGGLFSLIALFPALLLAVFAAVSIDRTFETFFSMRVKSIVYNSVDVAKAYMSESGQIIKSDTMSIAREIEENAALYREDKFAFENLFGAIVSLRSIPYAFIIDGNGKVLASGQQNIPYQAPPPEDLERAKNGRPIPLSWDLSNGVAALQKLNGFGDAYLFVSRPVNPNVYRLLQRTQLNILQFNQLEQARSNYQFVFALMYVLMALTLLTSAIWIGLVFANRLVMPIRQLINAAQEVSQGHLDVQLEEGSARDDIGRLRKTFKQMTVDLKTQRDDIMSANRELEERRRFIEAVLSGVSAGVIGLDRDGKITLVNRSACELLGVREAKLIGKALKSVVPEFHELMEKSKTRGRKAAQSQVTIVRESGERNFSVRVTREQPIPTDLGHVDYGVVVTFDDVTELTVAQRASAWADVARRIAHEIKNPLTPIQLSAERIRRKYADHITTDREVFDRCTDTIIRHVGDIGRMVDEFSSFARMPKPVFEPHDAREIVREAVILFQMSRPEIEFKIEMPASRLEVLCDRRLITQAVTNLVKNASEAVDAYHHQANGDASEKGRIVVRLTVGEQRFVIEVTDNGCGLPKENRHRLVEPYITTRQKGTGLGLAIVQRITEQHGGALELADAPAEEGYTHGARISMILPLTLSTEAFSHEGENGGQHKPNGKADSDTSVTQEDKGMNYGV